MTGHIYANLSYSIRGMRQHGINEWLLKQLPPVSISVGQDSYIKK